MADEIITNPEQTTPEEEMGAADYISKLNELRKGTVDIAKYNKLVEENKQLVNALANGEHRDEDDEEHEPSADIAARLFAKSPKYRNDLAYFTDVLAYRDALIEEGGEDPFLPFNHEYQPTAQDAEYAQRIADSLRECVEYANGDPSIFASELKRRGVNIQTRRV